MNWKENWRQIENKYPKAYALWMQFDSPEAKICVTYRDLYDFFDKQGIYVAITTLLKPHTDDSTRFFEWDIDIEYETFMDYELYNTRQEAEEAAFLQAFEILEEKLK